MVRPFHSALDLSLIAAGPGSWLSICSEPGLRWVSDRLDGSEFPEIAQGLIRDWTKHLTLAQYPIRQRGPELDVQTAWRYSAGMSGLSLPLCCALAD